MATSNSQTSALPKPFKTELSPFVEPLSILPHKSFKIKVTENQLTGGRLAFWSMKWLLASTPSLMMILSSFIRTFSRENCTSRKDSTMMPNLWWSTFWSTILVSATAISRMVLFILFRRERHQESPLPQYYQLCQPIGQEDISSLQARGEVQQRYLQLFKLPRERSSRQWDSSRRRSLPQMGLITLCYSLTHTRSLSS